MLGYICHQKSYRALEALQDAGILLKWHVNCNGLLYNKLNALHQVKASNGICREKIHVPDSNLCFVHWSQAVPRCDWLLWSFHARQPHLFCPSWLPSSNGGAPTPDPGAVLCQHQSGTKPCVNFTASLIFCCVSSLVAVAVVEGLRILGHSGLGGQGGGQGLDEDNEWWWTPDWVISLLQCCCCCIHHTPYFRSFGFCIFSFERALEIDHCAVSVLSQAVNVVWWCNWMTNTDQEVSGVVVCGKSGRCEKKGECCIILQRFAPTLSCAILQIRSRKNSPNLSSAN